ncbi:sesquiterpene synthase 12 [Solanum lycopersicum]|uniref:Sesquiterpene synthase 12 n=1 Tax=Solanum lycopersicum TaxID=4081 RepID=TPS12_SOLLC|nr:sesquiterpene synthase 12 [Solanum lycopersicum]D5KXD2.1 RecName: Full=Sesquiterpene synthase 12; Short=SlTPS12; Short=Terpene synthase 12; AltName: Full=(E)-beta-ocimene synthase TPS12; AltName: Full=(Z)-gamma-bisabolene synthase TPS12; AltName: Full=Alpha-humulene synthase TPS12; AltName: Full=Beta bisabolene synthase TPS12; AltName: Full=Beta caryophyllene synthase TPS12; AltName: Full=Beta-myrcene synthase TPS12; AltName: Full=Gamma-curcumene synthase TPS12; AltName: Full=Limonene synthase 
MASSSANKCRPLANFHPTVWGYHFLSYTHEITNQEKVEVDEYKETIRKMLVEAPEGSEQKLVLIDAMQRLGVAYHFDNEIETSIQNIFDASSKQNDNDNNLYVVSLRFRLVRQQGHYMSSDVFKQFINQDGKFKETLTNDVQGLLSLYEASHLRVRDEEILEEALTFTTTHLESTVSNLSNNNSLKAEVTEAFSQPIRMTLPRVGARKYISIYENNDAHNHLLLKFAKLDFNMLQKLHQRELSDLTRWWKDLDFANKYPYARDRLVECYFWILGVYFEPKYSRARKMMTKVIQMASFFDDTFDAYATFDELEPFNNAIQRWDINAIDSVPPYLRHAYQALLDIYSEMEQALAKEFKSDRVYYAKYEMKKLVRAYFKEAQWLNNDNHIPKYEEHMENAMVSAGYMMGATTCLVGVEEFISKETFEWMINEPLIVRASSLIARAMDDIVGHEVEQQREHGASLIECYMKDYGVSKQEAYVKFQKEVTNGWMDINREFFCPDVEVPKFVLERVLNFTRVINTLYKEKDEYTNSKGKFKNMIISLLVESVEI